MRRRRTHPRQRGGAPFRDKIFPSRATARHLAGTCTPPAQPATATGMSPLLVRRLSTPSPQLPRPFLLLQVDSCDLYEHTAGTPRETRPFRVEHPTRVRFPATRRKHLGADGWLKASGASALREPRAQGRSRRVAANGTRVGCSTRERSAPLSPSCCLIPPLRNNESLESERSVSGRVGVPPAGSGVSPERTSRASRATPKGRDARCVARRAGCPPYPKPALRPNYVLLFLKGGMSVKIV